MERLKHALSRASGIVKEHSGEEVLVVHHDDADGVTSAAIMSSCLEKAGCRAKALCIEKLYPQVAYRLHPSDRLVIYVDLGSPHAPFISEVNKGGCTVIILDHHDPAEIDDQAILHINPELFGFSGEELCSGASITYLMAKTMSEESSSLSPLAIVGSAEIPGKLRGLNEIALRDSLRLGLAKEVGRTIKVRMGDSFIDYRYASSKLTVLASVGYFRGGPRLAVEACTKGITGEVESRVREFEDERRSADREVLRRLYGGGMVVEGMVQWFHAHDLYRGMGGKVIGTLCSYISYRSRIIDADKYILGFMNLPLMIPGLGKVGDDVVKVSARVSQPLKERISMGAAPPLSELLPGASSKCGGFGDGHAYAASGIIPKGMEGLFVDEMNKAIGDYLGGGRGLERFF